MVTGQELNIHIDVLSKAIRRRSAVSFIYQNNEKLVAEPVVLGVHKETNKVMLRCYKSFPQSVTDTKENWYLCDLDDISNIRITPIRTKSFRKGAKTLEGDMSEIIESTSAYVKA